MMTSVYAAGPPSLLEAKVAQLLTSWALALMMLTLLVCISAGNGCMLCVVPRCDSHGSSAFNALHNC